MTARGTQLFQIRRLRWAARASLHFSRSVPRFARVACRWGYRNTTEMERASIVLAGDSYVEDWYVSDDQAVTASPVRQANVQQISAYWLVRFPTQRPGSAWEACWRDRNNSRGGRPLARSEIRLNRSVPADKPEDHLQQIAHPAMMLSVSIAAEPRPSRDADASALLSRGRWRGF
jgi:hypothetical protein